MQNKPKAELTAALMLLDTRSMSFDAGNRQPPLYVLPAGGRADFRQTV